MRRDGVRACHVRHAADVGGDRDPQAVRSFSALDGEGLLDAAAPLLQALPEGAVPEALRSRVASDNGRISTRGVRRIADTLAREPASRPFVALVDRLVIGSSSGRGPGPRRRSW